MQQVTEKNKVTNEQLVQIAKDLNVSIETLNKLIYLTSGIKGVSFVSIKNYTSDISNNTELANQLINVGASYEKMKEKDAISLDNVNLENIDFNKFNWNGIDTKNLTIEEFKSQVKNSLETALDALKQPSKKIANNNIYLNKILMYNTNTKNLLIKGQSVNKTTKVKGEFKKVQSRPLTVAKKLIKNQFTRKDTLRNFKLSNLETINLSKDTIEIR